MHVLIVGSGPAGISAALYARRGGADTTVITKGSGFLETAERIENYYGLSAPVSGPELERRGIEGAKRLGVVFVEDEVIEVRRAAVGGGFVVEGKHQDYAGDAVILATGVARRTLSIPGVREYEGHGVSYCAICDAFFYRGKVAAVVGSGDYALHEARILQPHAERIIMMTNGEDLTIKVPHEIEVQTGRILRLEGTRRVQRIVFADAPALDVDGVFMAIGVAGSSDLAMKLGVLLKDAKVVVNENMETNIPGIYAAGDCTGGLLQIVKAAYEGARAGLSAVRYLRHE